jgi:hypothetical protein
VTDARPCRESSAVDRSGTGDEDFRSDSGADGRLGRESVALDLKVVGITLGLWSPSACHWSGPLENG